MAKEIKSFKCSPEAEQQEIEFRQKCGWEFVSTQEIYNQDTHLESSIFTDTITSVTETTHYVKLTFQRDRDNVKPEILQLEQKIDNSYPPSEPKLWSGLFIFGGFLIYIIPGILMLHSNKKKKESYQAQYDSWKNEFEDMLASLDQLL